jgi:uncharacterized protein (TIRG00374 family)
MRGESCIVTIVSNPSFRKWVSILAVLGFVAFLLYLYFFTDIAGIVSVIGRANVYFFILALICVLASVSFNALVWHRLLVNLSIKMNYRMIFNLTWVGIFIDGVIPGGWSGKAFIAYLLSRDPNIDIGKSASSIVIKNILEILVILVTSVLGLILLVLNYTLESGVLLTIGTTMLLLTLPLFIIIYLSLNPELTKKILRAFKRLYSFIRRRPDNIEGFEKKIEKSLKEYRDGINALRANPKSLLQSGLFQTIAWSFDILALFLIFASIGFVVPADKVIITNSITVNLQAQGVALAGFAQIVTSSVYTILGISPIISVASTVLYGFASFWFKIIIAFSAFQFVVLSRCVPPFCLKLNRLRGKSCEDEKLLAKSNSNE